ncbi:hypothetical protein, partial [Pseudomonas sp. FW306-02-F04-AA]|uniref:hypothetical protein n=1 Tax=Pseudomonas sp. FW306-02-F04-AA TaxID=2070658 RepID=UPI001304D32E
NSNDKQAASGGTQNTVAAASNVVAVVAPPSPGLPLYNFTVVSESWSLNGAASTSSAPDLSAYTALAADASYIESIDAAIQTQQDNLELYSKG